MNKRTIEEMISVLENGELLTRKLAVGREQIIYPTKVNIGFLQESNFANVSEAYIWENASYVGSY